jgi:hypothetical protein
MEKQRRTGRGNGDGARRMLIGRLLPFGVLGLVVVVLATWSLMSGTRGSSDAAQVRGGPRLVVDQDLIDFGAVRYGQFVEARFRLKNVGDQPLRLPDSPPIEVVEGC